MSEEWDTVTKIGQKVSGGGGGPREKVVRGKSALNAAQRTGTLVATEKKFATGNMASKPAVEGQHLTKVDRADDTAPVPKVPKSVGDIIETKRQNLPTKLSRKQLAEKASIKLPELSDLVTGQMPLHQANKHLEALEKVLNVRLRGDQIGEPKFGPKKAKK